MEVVLKCTKCSETSTIELDDEPQLKEFIKNELPHWRCSWTRCGSKLEIVSPKINDEDRAVHKLPCSKCGGKMRENIGSESYTCDDCGFTGTPNYITYIWTRN